MQFRFLAIQYFWKYKPKYTNRNSVIFNQISSCRLYFEYVLKKFFLFKSISKTLNKFWRSHTITFYNYVLLYVMKNQLIYREKKLNQLHISLQIKKKHYLTCFLQTSKSIVFPMWNVFYCRFPHVVFDGWLWFLVLISGSCIYFRFSETMHANRMLLIR